MLDSNRVPIEQSALLVIDAQDSFKVGASWERRNNLAFENNVGALIAAYRVAELPVIFFSSYRQRRRFRHGQPFF